MADGYVPVASEAHGHGRLGRIEAGGIEGREAGEAHVGRIAAAAGSEAVKARLRVNTDEVIARGGYGSPTIFVDKNDMYFGNDQLPLVRQRIEKQQRGG